MKEQQRPKGNFFKLCVDCLPNLTSQQWWIDSVCLRGTDDGCRVKWPKEMAEAAKAAAAGAAGAAASDNGDGDLHRRAAEILLKEAERGKARAAKEGALAWKQRRPATNKLMLANTLRNTVVANAASRRDEDAQKKRPHHHQQQQQADSRSSSSGKDERKPSHASSSGDRHRHRSTPYERR
eukprot:m.179625 g.179625  ORF g.179625 m.179625 type:complete len:181 (-) comp17412_c1_seq1:60-602(-)